MRVRSCLFTALLVTLIGVGARAQAPNGISYQAVLRDADGKVLSNQSATLRLSLTGSDGATVYFSETHSVQTDALGMMKVVLGGGQVETGSFAGVPWSSGGPIYLKVEVKLDGQPSYTPMGSEQLQSVPYALASADGVGGSGTKGALAIWDGAKTLADLPNMTFSNSLSVVGSPTANPDDPIFEVKNSNGDIIFGVYQEGVRINIKDDPIGKGLKGGFAVGGLTNQTKAGPVEYLRITPDSARIYVKQETGTKGLKGGFAVGGLTNQVKGVVSQNLLFLAPDSARIYVKEDGTKGVKGGFAVGGLTNQTKGNSAQLIHLNKENYLIGHRSGENLVDGSGIYNSIFGYNAGMSLTTGRNNVLIGTKAGYSINTGHSNIVMGNMAGSTIDNGSQNIIIGDSAGLSGKGIRAIIIGNNAGKNAGSFYEATFIGNGAGANDVSYFPNTFIGNMAGYNNTSGMQNTFIGNSAGYSNTVGNSNIFIGNYAAYSNTSGGQNVFVGEVAGYSNTTAGGNTFVGYHSGYSNTTGHGNSFFGNYSGNQNTSGINNTFIGNGCGSFNVDGEDNTFVGQQAGGNISQGLGNSFFGQSAGLAITSGDNNLFVGTGSGYYKTSGNNNVFIGNRAGALNSTGNSNVFIGYRAGFDAQGSNRLYISNSDVDSTQALIFGRFDAKVLAFNAKVGIGTLTPDKNLTVIGNARVTGDIYYGTGATIYNKPDFVFGSGYADYFTPTEVDRYINRHGHLPWLTPASKENDGVNLTRMQFETVETVENLQLQIIEQQRKIDEQQDEIEQLKAELKAIKKMLQNK